MKGRILFVDDEPNVLDGLQRMLRPMRREWDMAFAQGGQEALDTLAQQHVDIIMSDMRMPGMDGPALLTEVMRRYPHIVRIVLSGHSSRAMVERVVGVAHQCLSKPCDAETVKNTITNALGLRALLDNESLTQLLPRIQSLPSVPSVYAEIMEELQNPDTTIKKVGEIISKDPGMTAKMLQLVNSAFFGLPRRVSSPAEAAVLLGADTIQALALGLGVFSKFGETVASALDLESLWKHTIQAATIAKQIAATERAPREVVDNSLMAGILHDVGKLVLAREFPDQYCKVTKQARQTNARPADVERAEFGVTHAEVGAYLLGLWGLPDCIVRTVAFHHCPANSTANAFSPLTAVHVADAFEHDRNADGGDGGSSQLDLEYLRNLSLIDRIPAWRDACETVLAEGADG